MASPYDQNLLASAPKATKAQLQDGYNPDLLVEKTSSTPTTPAADTAPLTPVQRQSEDALPLKKKNVPFYSTKKGIIIIAVVVVAVVVAAVVGGAVGGTRHKKTTTTTSVGEQGGGIAPTSTGVGQPFGTSPSPSSAPQATQGMGRR